MRTDPWETIAHVVPVRPGSAGPAQFEPPIRRVLESQTRNAEIPIGRELPIQFGSAAGGSPKIAPKTWRSSDWAPGLEQIDKIMRPNRCPICDSGSFREILEILRAPVHVGAVWPDAKSAKASARGDIRLAFCGVCGLLFNAAFDPSLVDYSGKYDNALGFSPTFQAFESALCERLIDRYGIRHRDVIELGAGSGRFLARICELGENRGVGFDPSHSEATADPLLGSRAKVLPAYYSEQDAGRKVDLVCSRHMLEHLDDPIGLLRLLRRNLERQPETIVYFEVPNAHLILSQKSIWDVIYEHASYFVPSSLAFAFRAAGFEVLDVQDCYAGQFASVEARIDPSWSPDRPIEPARDPSLEQVVLGFASEFARARATWSQKLDRLAASGSKIVLWGGGAKAVSFVHLIDRPDSIAYVVDINPGKQGSFLGGGGQEIVSPARLLADPPDVVIVMNPIYTDEIVAQIRDMKLSPRVMDVAGGDRGVIR